MAFHSLCNLACALSEMDESNITQKLRHCRRNRPCSGGYKRLSARLFFFVSVSQEPHSRGQLGPLWLCTPLSDPSRLFVVLLATKKYSYSECTRPNLACQSPRDGPFLLDSVGGPSTMSCFSAWYRAFRGSSSSSKPSQGLLLRHGPSCTIS